jgi:hypothetical protein
MESSRTGSQSGWMGITNYSEKAISVVYLLSDG